MKTNEMMRAAGEQHDKEKNSTSFRTAVRIFSNHSIGFHIVLGARVVVSLAGAHSSDGVWILVISVNFIAQTT